MQTEVCLENLSTGTNLLYVTVLRLAKKLPELLEGVLTKFYENAAHCMRTGKYTLFLVSNIGKTSAFF